MKKSIISLGLMLSAMFTLTNCAKELDAPVETPEQEGIPYEIIASVDPSTKTANDGVSTKWVANDALNVFYAEAGTTAYSTNRKFTVLDVAAGRFTGTLEAAKPLAASNDWYVLYPYSKYIQTPANTTNGWAVIGSDKAQKQDGIDNMTHIAGDNYPVYGVAKASSSQEIPSIKMKHVAAVLKVVVTNNSGKELSVNSIKFTAPEKISGKFFLDITKEPIVFTPNKYDVFETATLDVVNATIPVDGEAAFYLALKPFQAKDQDLTIEVNGYAKTIKAANTTFTAGKIKTLTFNFDQKPPIYSTAFNYIGGTDYQSKKPVIGTDAGTTLSWGITLGNWSGDECGQMRVYKNKSAGLYGELYMMFDVKGVTSVDYKASSTLASLKLNTYYSTDSGLTWTIIDDALSLTTELKSYSLNLPSLDKESTVRFKFVANLTATPSSTQKLTIDDVQIFGDGQIVAAHDIAVGQQTLTLDYTGAAQNLELTSNGAWKAEFVKNASMTTDPAVTIDPASGNASNVFNTKETISVSTVENKSVEKVTLGTIKFIDIESNEVKATTVLKQEGRPANGVSVDNAKVTLASGANKEVVVNVTCNWKWEATITEGSGFTIASDATANTITIKSTVESGAQGTILVKDLDDPTQTTEIAVSQAAAGSNPFVEMTTFTASGSKASPVVMDSNISYYSEKGGGTSDPFITSDGELRLYQNGNGGGKITIFATNGKQIVSVEIKSSNGTTVGYDGIKSSMTANKVLSVTPKDPSSITFTCFGNSKGTRLNINYLKVTYK